MSSSYNRVILVGNLTRDVELRYIPSGTAVTEITLAINDRYKKDNQWVEETSFFDVTLWGRTAEIAAEYLSKGSSILVEGRLKQDRWEQEGQKRSKVKVIGDRMQMLGTKSGMGGSHDGDSGHSHDSHDDSEHSTVGASASSQGPPPADEVPF